jgi:hypothetical protein
MSQPWLRRIRRVMRMAAPVFEDPAPTITSIDPEDGFAVGGIEVDIVGTGFLDGAEVFFNDTPAENVFVASSTLIQCDTPALAGTLTLRVRNPDGQTATLFDAFDAIPAPDIVLVNPATGSELGGTAVTITGSGFRSGAAVTFGGASATSIVVVSDGEITCVTPARTVGAKDVVVTNTDTQTDTLTNGFTYVFDPAGLVLQGYWRASYSASPWVGVASAGGSGGRNATEATNPPAAGSAVNTLVPADFDGSNDRLAPTGTTDTYIAALAASGWLLVLIDAIAVNNANPLANDGVFGNTEASPTHAFGISVRNTGGGLAYVSLNSGSSSGGASASRAIATGAWALITWRYNGTALQIGVNEAPGAAGGAASVAYSTSIGNLTNLMRIGQATSLSFFNGKMLECAITDIALTDQNFADVKASCNSRYGLAL